MQRYRPASVGMGCLGTSSCNVKGSHDYRNGGLVLMGHFLFYPVLLLAG
jgi:hypothetical protein